MHPEQLTITKRTREVGWEATFVLTWPDTTTARVMFQYRPPATLCGIGLEGRTTNYRFTEDDLASIPSDAHAIAEDVERYYTLLEPVIHVLNSQQSEIDTLKGKVHYLLQAVQKPDNA